MKNLNWFKQIANNARLERPLSFGEYNRAASWSKYLASSGGEIKGEGEEEWGADMSQLFIGTKFASGRHSRIYRGVYKDRDVAIKLISQPEEDSELAVVLEKQFNSEVAMLFRLQHPNIITFFAACKKAPVFCIITEYLAGGSLRAFLHQQEPYSLPINLVLKFAIDIARGMQFLHSQGVLHRDLKSENLLLGEDMCVKVADFGISCLESQCGSAKGFTGTYRWMAPEMIKGKAQTKKVDVYSFGIVLWELLTSLTPFDNMTPEQAAFAVCQKITDAKMIYLLSHEKRLQMNSCRLDLALPKMLDLTNARPLLHPACPLAFHHLINQCWAGNPRKRPDFNKIVKTLESFEKSLEQDPQFFSTYKPRRHHTVCRFFPKCESAGRSA